MALTWRGGALLGLTALVLVLATWAPVLGWVALAYFLGALGVLWADARAAGGGSRFEVSRRHDQRLSLNADNRVTVTVVERDRRRPAQFRVRDEAPDVFVISQRVLAGACEPGGTWNGLYTVRPLRRGDYAFADLVLRWVSPLGLLIRQARYPAAAPVKVYPNLYDVRRYDLSLRRNRLRDVGVRPSRMLGSGNEFERLRDYQPDDEYRHINWKATARHNRPIATQYQVERSQSVIALVDTGRMMQSPVADIAKLDYVLNAVLLLGYVGAAKGDKIGTLTFADQVDTYLEPRAGRGQFYRMLESLYAVDAVPIEPNYGRAVAYLRRRHRKRALVVIFTDLSSGPALAGLARHAGRLARQSLVLVVTIADPDIAAVAAAPPADVLGVYRNVAASQTLDERRALLEALHRQGVLTLDVPADQLSLAVVNRYLDLKARMQL